eukprot:TRINITY_DN2305_c0_g1_i1.p1 TRINITY_DN2305_c0_g1~~TRINITY_DN2305_c0_g1_i1.p1  ORF type:complete len:107 (+),score=26.91 TRINITY_DN2305_c0_g1_i1:47-367(+)
MLGGLVKKREKDPEKEELIKQVKELRERVASLEHDNDVLVSENLSLQEQLEEEKMKNYDVIMQRVEDKREQISALNAEEANIEEQRELLKAVTTEINKFSAELQTT